MDLICPLKHWTILIANTIIPYCLLQPCIFLSMSPLLELKCLMLPTFNKHDYSPLACNTIHPSSFSVTLTFILCYSRPHTRQYPKHEYGPNSQVQSHQETYYFLMLPNVPCQTVALSPVSLWIYVNVTITYWEVVTFKSSLKKSQTNTEDICTGSNRYQVGILSMYNMHHVHYV